MTVLQQNPTEVTRRAAPVCSGASTLVYEKLLPLIQENAVHETAAVQLTTQLRRMAVAMGTLVGRALGVHDFAYQLSPVEVEGRRRLSMCLSNERRQQLIRAELVIELTPEGYLFRLSEMTIRQSSPQPLATLS